MWPVQSRWNQYSACRSLIGRDSMRVRSIPRTASSVSSPSSEPGRFWVVAASVVRSWPVGAGGGPGGVRSTKRVTAPALSATSSARISRPNCSAASGAQTAASISPRGHLGGRLAGGGADQDVRVRKVAGDPVAGLGDAVVVRRDGPDLLDRRARTDHGGEPDRQHHLFDDHQRRVVEQPVQHRWHGALDAVLDRHAARVGLPGPDGGEDGRVPRARHQFRAPGLRKRQQGLLGEGRVRAEERQSGHGRRA